MYLVKQSCIILINSIANCAKENIFSKKKKKFMHRAVPPQNNSCTGNGPKKKNSGRLKIPHPPHHFSNGPSLTANKALLSLLCILVIMLRRNYTCHKLIPPFPSQPDVI